MRGGPGRRGFATSSVEGVLVVAPQGAFDGDSMRSLHGLLQADASTAAIIDLTDCTLVDLGVLRDVDPSQLGRPAEQVCVVCRRSTGWALLHRAGVPGHLSVFHGIEDALQARAFAEAGYGSGWARA